MLKTVKEFLKRILVVTMIFITLVIFGMEPIAKAAQLPADGEFYYSGTTKGTYVVTENIFKWLLSHLADIVDWLLGFMTMAFRLSIIGWATILERLLTKVLESSAGNSYLSDALNATNITAANDSSQNVTVEAIVYNRVPLFNVNFFDFEVDKTRTGTGRDLTKLVCDRCKKYYGDCTCTEEMCVCTSCETYRIMQKVDSDPNYKSIIIIIKETVAEWFYMIRFIAVIGMLMVLILIGIKIAISTLSSEKAVYKRMLVDWLVGFLFFFAVQYIMYFIIYLNQLAVDLIADYSENQASAIIQTSSLEFGKTERDNEEVEASLYEAVRTRAYDPKLINGTTGTIMYITLVIFAWRFAWMYLKRYFTLIVLTLMAPAVAFAYALQKVFSGKAKAWSTWLNEYIVNTFIQTVHAILYASFVSTALIVSLDSIAGMVVGLIIMNFMLKADKVFRKIFKMSTGGSLLDRVSKGAEEARLDKMAKSVQNAVAGAKPALQLAAKSPGAALVRTAKNAVVGEAVLGGAKIKDKLDRRKERKLNEKLDHDSEEELKKREDYDDLSTNESRKGEYAMAKAQAMEKARLENNVRDKVLAMSPEARDAHAQALADEEKDALAKAMASRDMSKHVPVEEQKALFDKYREVSKRRKQFDKYCKRPYSNAEIIAARVFDLNKYYYTDGNGKLRRRTSYEFDEKTNTIRRVGAQRLANRGLNAKDALGWNDAQIEAFKGTIKTASSGILAQVAAFAGLATLVTSPGAALGMLAYSANASAKYGRRNRNISRPTHRSAYQNRQYSNLRLTAKSAEKVTETVIYETMEGYALEPYRGTGIAQARITGILLDKYTPKQFKELTKDNDAYAAASVAALEELKQQVGFVNGLRTFSLDKLNQVELQQLDTITAGKVKGFEDMTDVDRDTKRTEVLMDLISQRDQLQGVDLSLYDENGIKETSMRRINKLMLTRHSYNELKALIKDPEAFQEQVEQEVQREIKRSHKTTKKAVKEVQQSPEMQKIQEVVDGIYTDEMGTYGPNDGDILDFIAGGAAEELDKLAALDNEMELKHIAKLRKEAGVIQAKFRTMDMAAVMDKIDKASAEEEKEKAENTLFKNGDKRVVAPVITASLIDDLIKEAMTNLNLTPPLSPADKQKLKAEVNRLAGGELRDRLIGEGMAEYNGEMTAAIEKEIIAKVDQKITSEIRNRFDNAVSRYVGDTELIAERDKFKEEMKKKDPTLTEDDIAAKAVEEKGITEEERANIAKYVKEAVKANGINNVDMLKSGETIKSIADSYRAEMQGKGTEISEKEAMAQVASFMEGLKEVTDGKSFSERAHDAIQARVNGSTVSDFTQTQSSKKKNDILEAMRSDVVSTEEDISPELIAEQNRLIVELFENTAEATALNAEFAGYGKKRAKPADALHMYDYTDSMQYVKFDEKRELPKAYRAAKGDPDKKAEVYGPMINIDEIIGTMKKSK